jgi:hypothetical protein
VGTQRVHAKVAIGAVIEQLGSAGVEVGEPGDELLGRQGGRLPWKPMTAIGLSSQQISIDVDGLWCFDWRRHPSGARRTDPEFQRTHRQSGPLSGVRGNSLKTGGIRRPAKRAGLPADLDRNTMLDHADGRNRLRDILFS